MATEYNKYKLEKLFKNIKEKSVVLPEFQRGYIWTVDQQRNLIASFVVDLPIGSTLHIEGKKDDFTARAICEQKEIIPRNDCEYLLDGQQRISTLYNALRDIFKEEKEDKKNWKEIWDRLFKKIKNRWFLKVNNEIFGYNKLKFDKNKIISKEPIEIKDFIVNKPINKVKDKDKWYHPDYIPKDENGDKLKGAKAELNIAKNAANEKLVPLHEIYKKEKGIHRRILREIAKNKVSELQAEVEDGDLKINSLFPEIENPSKEEIQNLWIERQISWMTNISNFLEGMLNKEIPVIWLQRNEIARAAAIFEEINKGGTPLSIFDLIVAKAARSTKNKFDKSLVKFILEILDQKFDISHLDNGIPENKWKASLFTSIKENLPSKKFQSLYLNLLSIVSYEEEGKGISKELISRNKILSLKPDYVVKYTEKVTKAIARTYAFLQLKCGHIDESLISYDYMILPIAYLFCTENIWEDLNNIKKIEA